MGASVSAKAEEGQDRHDDDDQSDEIDDAMHRIAPWCFIPDFSR
jgi:hypothetical protein